MAVTIVIGLWIYDETSYNKNHTYYDRFACVYQNLTIDGTINTMGNQSYQLGDELRNNYDNLFERVVMYYGSGAILSYNKRAFTIEGSFMESGAPELLSLNMVKGNRDALLDPSGIIVSKSAAKKLFEDEDPIGKAVRLDNREDLKITGVYEDLPANSSFKQTDFIAPLKVLIDRGGRNFGWVNNWLLVFVQLRENVDMQSASLAIKDVKLRNVDPYEKRYNPELFLHALSNWRLYDDFENGGNAGGRIEVVRLFSAIGAFVLMLACINFMNLSTARYQQRAKEVGIRKVIGSARGQLVRQFYAESLVVVLLSSVVALVIVQLSLPLFNEVVRKQVELPWSDPVAWSFLLSFVIFTVLVSGSYPALYLSAFSPIKVLKGTFRAGRLSAVPRRMLVTLQFIVSIVLAIGTIVVYQQIEYARNRPMGYDLNGLITIPIKTPEVKKTYEAMRNELIASGVAIDVSKSEQTVTNQWWSDSGMGWKGKDPNLQDIIHRGSVDYDFGKTVGWKIKEGRDFSREFGTDSSAMILNEAAVKYMGFEQPVGEVVRAYGKEYTVIGVVEDMLSQSLYLPVQQAIFILDPFNSASFINVKIVQSRSTSEALVALDRIFVKHNPDTPFEYNFANEEFKEKFETEAQVGQLSGIFAGLAIFISCLGLFGLAAFVAGQRTKEIGIRKVLGASVFNLWQMLSKDFMVITLMAIVIATPVAYVLMEGWLQEYNYRTEISGFVLIACGLGALLITLLTVSAQAIKAALANPVNSLRSE